MPEAPKPPTPPAAQDPDVQALAPDDRIAEQLDRIMRDKGTEGGLRVLYDDNLDVRNKNGKLRELVTDARNRLPPAGSIVLTGDDAATYEALVALGIPLKDVATRLKTGEGSDAALRATALEQRAVHQEAAELLGWDAKVLTSLATDKGLTINVVDGKAGEESIRLPVVVVSDTEQVGLADYEPLKMHHRSLKLDAGSEPPGRSTPPPTTTTPPPRVLRQSSGATGTTPKPDLGALIEQARATGPYSRF